MQSNHSPEVSSTHSHPNASNSAENRSNSPSRKKQISPKLRRSPSKPAPSTSTANEKESVPKRKINSSEKITEKMKRATNGSDPMPSSSKDTKQRFPTTTDNDSLADYDVSQNHFPHTSQSNYAAMLNLAPDTGSIEEGNCKPNLMLFHLYGSTSIRFDTSNITCRIDSFVDCCHLSTHRFLCS